MSTAKDAIKLAKDQKAVAVDFKFLDFLGKAEGGSYDAFRETLESEGKIAETVKVQRAR